MYAPAMVARREARLFRERPSFRTLYPSGIPIYSVRDHQGYTAQLASITQPDGTLLRPYTDEEQTFIAATQLRIQFDFEYFATRCIYIDEEGHGLRPLYPLWESQQYLLQLLGTLELAHDDAGAADGLLVNILKIRQVGITTLGVCLLAHRLFTRPHMRGLVGSDIESQAGYLFRIAERVYVNLPPCLQPQKVGYNKDRELLLSNGSSLRTAWGKSTRGALQEVGGKKGNIERGRTYPLVHISELATWDNPEQLDTALLPGIPRSPHTLVLFESTAELADDWWHRHWRTAAAGTGRFRNLFIGAYAVPAKYSLRPPADWTPKDSTIAWAAKAERESPQWCFGQTIKPSLAQCYWYESTRDFYESKGKLHDFLREYPSDPEECFQYAGQTIFTHPQLQAIDEAGTQRKVIDTWTVAPAREIAALRREATPDLADMRRPAPLTPTLTSPVAHASVLVPPGYGFQRVPTADLKARLEAALPPHARFRDWLTIWEYPRPRGPRRYVLSVDVADGLGLDYSVIDVIRLPTVEEPAEQVAQWLSNTVAAKDLAFICDAIGRYYTDEEGLEALAAIETNNHGLATQDLLQLHLGYSHFYIWEYADAASPERRFSTRIGWVTSPRTRPLLLSAFHAAVTTRDPVTQLPDLVLNSAVTRSELRHLVTEGTLGEAEAARGQHDDCLPPDTLIRTRQGVKPISHVVVGDEVLTHMGRWRPVTRVGCREASELAVLTIAGRRPVRLTTNHRLLLCYRQPKWGKPGHRGGTAGLLTHDLPEWRSVDDGEDLTGFAATAVALRETVNRTSIALQDYAPANFNVVDDRLVAFTYGGTRENPKQARPPAVVAVDADFCRLLGYYYAEGSRGRHNVGWAGHLRESHIREWLVTYLHRLGLSPSTIQTSPNGVIVSAGSVPFNRFFAEFGSRQLKQFPAWVEILPPEKQREVLVGWLLGDGCFRNTGGGIVAATISTHGAYQLYEMAIRCGWTPTLQLQPQPRASKGQRPVWLLTFSAFCAAQIRACIPANLLADKRPVTTLPRFDRRWLRNEQGYLLGHVLKVERQPYAGLVYNLEVEEDHSYVANGTVVHNCVMAAAIGYYVAYRLAGGEAEPIAEKRRRRQLLHAQAEQAGQPRPDWRNLAVTAEEADHATDEDDDTRDERTTVDDLFFPH